MFYGVHPWFFGIAFFAVISFIGITVWTFRTKRSHKTLPVIFLFIAITLSVGFWAANASATIEAQRQINSNLDVAKLLGNEAQLGQHSAIRLDGSTEQLKNKYVEMFHRWQKLNPNIAGIQTVRKTPGGKLQPIVQAGRSEFIESHLSSSSTFSRAWEGVSQIVQMENDRSVSISASPLKSPSEDKVEALLIVSFANRNWSHSQFDAQRGVLIMTSILLLLTLFGGVTGIALVQALAESRVARAEMTAQGDRIREQMEMIAEKNQLMATSHDALEQANKKLQSLATMDGLTGVMNHRALMEFLTVNMKRNSVIGSPSSVVLLDVDNFKQLNDHYGHIAGDDALRTLAAVLRQSCPKDAGVGRYGGEEFMLVLPGASESAAVTVAEELRRRIQMAKTSSRPVTVSIGVATVYSMSKSEQTLIDEADKALYHSKRSGKNRVTHFGHGLLESA